MIRCGRPAIPGMPGMAGSHENWGNFKCHKWGELLRHSHFKRSNDPEFAEKVEDIVGLYMDPPKHTVVVSIDEKSQIQALDRTQPACRSSPENAGR